MVVVSFVAAVKRPGQFSIGACYRLRDSIAGRCGLGGREWHRRRSGHQASRDTTEIDRLITHVTVVDGRHPLFGQTLEVANLRSDRGVKWVTVWLSDGRRRNVLRRATDLSTAPSDSKKCLLISARTLLRVAIFVETLLRRFEEERRDVHATEEQQPYTGPDQPLVTTAGCDAASPGEPDRTGDRPVATIGTGAGSGQC